MNYQSFINLVLSALTYQTISGVTTFKHTEFCLTDEPELDQFTQYPAAWVTPIPFNFRQSSMRTLTDFTCRIYVAAYYGTDRNQRIKAYNTCMNAIAKLVQDLENYNNIWGIVYPLVVTPVLLFDNNVDGWYIEITTADQYDCLK